MATHRVLWSVAEYFEDLRHLPSGSQVHSEAWHGAARGQADDTVQWRSQVLSLCLYQRRQSTPPAAISSQSQVVCLDWTQLFQTCFIGARGGKYTDSWNINRTDGENLKTSNQKRGRRGEERNTNALFRTNMLVYLIA